jgi:hypothetical protein
MSRFTQILGLAAVFICAVSLYWSLEQSTRNVAAEPSAWLDAIRHSLVDSGFHRHDDVSIKMNGDEVALGFSRPGCDGVILVAILPHTAQSWARMAPRLDLSSFRLGYFYKGTMRRAVPRLEWLAGRLLGDLGPQEAAMRPQVVAIAESGHCALAPSAAPALKAVSQGLLMSVGRPGLPMSTGDVSA